MSRLRAATPPPEILEPEPLPEQPEPEPLPESENEAAEPPPPRNLTDFMERILSAYEKDPMFKNKKRTKRYRLDEGFWLYGNRIVVPNRKQLQKSLIEMAHQPPTSGHTGAQRTYEQLRRTFYWPGMVHSVKTYVHACTSCQRNKASTRKPGGLLRPTEIPNKFWECVTMDLITQLPKSKHGFDVVAVFVAVHNAWVL